MGYMVPYPPNYPSPPPLFPPAALKKFLMSCERRSAADALCESWSVAVVTLLETMLIKYIIPCFTGGTCRLL